MNTDYVNLGDICRKYLNMQCQYGSRYAEQCKGLRITGSRSDYHSMTIHREDVKQFVIYALGDLYDRQQFTPETINSLRVKFMNDYDNGIITGKKSND